MLEMLPDDLASALDPSLLMTAAGMNADAWQADLLRSDARRVLLLCSRQAGKSTVTSALALHEALYRAPALVLLLSPSLRQSSELFKKVTSFYGDLKTPVPTRSLSALRMELENGSRIVSLPGKEATVRGYSGVSLLVIDEASRVEDSLYYSVRPMLAVSGGKLAALTTPFGKRGFFHQEWAAGGDGWKRVRITAHDCPRITPEFLEEERRALGSWWYDQEYMCIFKESVDSVFSHDLIMSAFDADIKPMEF